MAKVSLTFTEEWSGLQRLCEGVQEVADSMEQVRTEDDIHHTYLQLLTAYLYRHHKNNGILTSELA